MSSDDPVIRVEGVGKCFYIYDRPQDRLKQFILPKIRAVTGLARSAFHREFWALKDISFQIAKGQTVGIIGRNGSGKSTLLQIITGTMSPTCGNVFTQGRTAALLELGSGFNPDFTGRENVYLNGTLLGLTQAQVDEKFDYIAGFADIGEHLDQPVKTYSSGMMLRLAFAVQVAVETEILIIDEALAVGDARFQLKCFRRLEEIKGHGTTILFVSHATELIRSFCDFGLVLENGKAIYWGAAKTATVKYLEVLFPEQAIQLQSSLDDNPQSRGVASSVAKQIAPDHAVKPNQAWITIDPLQMAGHTFGVGGAELKWIKIQGIESPNLLVGGRKIVAHCAFSWDIALTQDLIRQDAYDQNITLGISIADGKGRYIFGCNGFDRGVPIDSLTNGVSTIEFTFTMPYLATGDYFLTAAIALGNQKHHVQLKWYDCIFQFKNEDTSKNIYGVFAIDYQMNILT